MNTTQYRLLTPDDGRTIEGDQFYLPEVNLWKDIFAGRQITECRPIFRRPFKPMQWLSVKEGAMPECGREVPVLRRINGHLRLGVEAHERGLPFFPDVEYWLDTPPFPEPQKSDAEKAWEALTYAKRESLVYASWVEGFNAARKEKP